MSERDGVQYVYRLTDSQDRLLYVGVTNNLDARMKEHRKYGARWFSAARNLRFDEYPDRDSARAAEREAIRTERPAINVLDAAERESWKAEGFALKTIGVDLDDWIDALRIAAIRDESLSGEVRDAVKRYVARHKHLLEEQGGADHKAQ